MILVKRLQQLLVKNRPISLLTVPLVQVGSISCIALVNEYGTCFRSRSKIRAGYPRVIGLRHHCSWTTGPEHHCDSVETNQPSKCCFPYPACRLHHHESYLV